MRAQFKASKPLDVEMSLTLTAPVSEWKRLMEALEKGEPAAAEMGRAVAKLIRQADSTLATENWTDGYTVGPVKGADA